MNFSNYYSAGGRRLTSLASAQLLSIARLAACERNLTVEDWLETRIRACLAIELADRLEPTSPKLRSLLHRWIANQIPFPSSLLPSLDDLCALMDATPSVDKSKSRGASPSAHVLYDEDAMTLAQKRISDKELGVHFAAVTRYGSTRQVRAFGADVRRRVAVLRQRAPHLAQATDVVLSALAVSARMGTGLRLPPILLSGPPAAGKTWWAREVAKALDLSTSTISMPQVTASFVLSGSSMSWSQARPGQVVEAFTSSECASPLLILDELDKANHTRYAPAPVLLALLEYETARHWRDEFFGCEFDVSTALFIATANNSESIDDALRSRFCEIRVDAPKGDQLASVIQSAWAGQRARYAPLRLPGRLPDQVVAGLVNEKMQVRQLQRCFDQAIGRAAGRRGALKLIPADFGLRALHLAFSR